MSHALLVVLLAGFAWLACLAVAAILIASVDWRPVVEQLAKLAVLLAVAYWASTLLPGPVKKVGRAVGRGVAGRVRKKRRAR